jgi:DNA-binding PadR family transcriptional regulator
MVALDKILLDKNGVLTLVLTYPMKTAINPTQRSQAKPLRPMQLFVLAMIAKGGVKTVYEMKRDAKLSQGGTRDALEWLEKKDYIKRSDPVGELQKKEFAVTSKGLQVLESKWQWGLNEFPNWDAETVLRVVWVALQMDRSSALELLTLYAKVTGEFSKLCHEYAEVENKPEPPLHTYRWMNAVLVEERFAAQSRALYRIVREFGAEPLPPLDEPIIRWRAQKRKGKK